MDHHAVLWTMSVFEGAGTFRVPYDRVAKVESASTSEQTQSLYSARSGVRVKRRRLSLAGDVEGPCQRH